MQESPFDGAAARQVVTLIMKIRVMMMLSKMRTMIMMLMSKTRPTISMLIYPQAKRVYTSIDKLSVRVGATLRWKNINHKKRLGINKLFSKSQTKH